MPPDWLATRSLPLIKVPQGTPLFRVHQKAHGALFFGPAVDPVTGVRQPPTYRFDSLVGAFGVLYVAPHFEGTFVETVRRNQQLRFVSESYVTLRAVTELTCSRELRRVVCMPSWELFDRQDDDYRDYLPGLIFERRLHFHHFTKPSEVTFKAGFGAGTRRKALMDSGVPGEGTVGDVPVDLRPLLLALADVSVPSEG